MLGAAPGHEAQNKPHLGFQMMLNRRPSSVRLSQYLRSSIERIILPPAPLVIHNKTVRQASEAVAPGYRVAQSYTGARHALQTVLSGKSAVVGHALLGVPMAWSESTTEIG